MDINTIISTLDNTDLKRDVVDLKGGGDTVSYGNYTGTDLTLTVNGTDYDKLLRICLVPLDDGTVKVYFSNIKVNNVTGIALTSINSISVGE